MNDGYIGCGIFSQSDAKIEKNQFHKSVRKYGYNNFKRHILCFCDTYEEALEEERYMVDINWVKNKNNYNSAIGGYGCTSSWMTDSKKEQWKCNISAGVKKWVENGGVEKMVTRRARGEKLQRFGADNSRFGKKSIRRKRVLKFNLNNEKVAEFESLTDAASSINSSAGVITSCCKGKLKACKGFIFRYDKYTEFELNNLNSNLNRIPEKEAKIKRAAMINKSFDENGRKRSIWVQDVNTGVVIKGISKLLPMYPNTAFATIKKYLLKDGIYNNHKKIPNK